MKNRIFHFLTTFFLLASFFGPAAAQTSTNTDSFHSSTEKKSIAIWPFTGNNNFNALSDLYNIVTDAVGKSERFLLIERQKIDAILKELDFQMGHETEYTDILVEQGKTLGANFYLFGHINSVTTKENISHDSKTGKTHISYTCNISLVLRIVDIETGLVKMTETIEVGNILSLLSSKSPELAFTKACKKIASKTKKYIKKAFPINLSIIRIEEEKKGKASKVLIAGGTAIGLKKNDKIAVFLLEEITINGVTEIREKQIATIQVSQVEGQKVSLCKVKKGGSLLKEKLLDGSKLLCRTI